MSTFSGHVTRKCISAATSLFAVVALLFAMQPLGIRTVTAVEAASPTGTNTVIVTRGGRSFETTTFDRATDSAGRIVRAGSLIVTFRVGTSRAERDSTHLKANGANAQGLGDGVTQRVDVNPKLVDEALANYRSQSNVIAAAPDYVVQADFTPNDPQFSNQWGMTKISAPAAWDVTQGSAAVKVAILDCGIYDSLSTFGPGHPDLSSKVVSDINFTTAFNADDYCNHGTHVAGIAAASSNNAVGVAGVGFNASILNVKVLDDTGSGSFSGIINGINWAANNGANVINMSLGAAVPCSAVPGLQDAISNAWSRGVVIVAAAGNSGALGASAPGNCANVISVAATDQTDAIATWSNYGPQVSVAAPGVNILSTDYVGGYEYLSGTSMASPHVAGLAALVWATPFGTSQQAVANQITANADRLGQEGALWAYGRINAARAVGTAPAPPPPAPAAPTALAATASSSSQINLAWADNSSNESGFTIERSLSGGAFAQVASVGAGVVTFSNTGLAASTSYTYRVRAYNAGGSSDYSNTSSATTLSAPPAAPRNLSARAISATQISLSWSDMSSNEAGFKIERSTNGTTFIQIAAVGANVKTYTNSGLTASTKYYYRVRAFSAGDSNSSYSNTARATTARR